jgi:hypothetical protein
LEDNNKMYVKEVEDSVVNRDRVHLVEDRIQWWAFVNTGNNLRILDPLVQDVNFLLKI